MNRIYQGRSHKAEPIDDKGNPLPVPEKWDGLTALWQHHALFQDAVNYYLVCLLALARPGNPLWPIREKLDAHDEAGQPDELMVWRPFRRRGVLRPGLRDSVAKYLTPGNDQPTPEECFAVVLAGNNLAQSEEGCARFNDGLRQLLENCTGESGPRDCSKEYLPRFCRAKTRCNYPESAISRRRKYHEKLLPLVMHSPVNAAAKELDQFNVFSIALPDYEKPIYAGVEARTLLGEVITDLKNKFPAESAELDRLAKLVEQKPDTLRVPGYQGSSAKGEKKFQLYAMFLFRYVERSEFTLRLLRVTTPKPDEADNFAFLIHSQTDPRSPLLTPFTTELIAKPDKKKATFSADEAKTKLKEMLEEWKKELPDEKESWQRLANKIADYQGELPTYAGVQRAKEPIENRRLRLFAFYLFKYVDQSEFTLRLLRLTTPRLNPPTRAEMAAGDPVQKSRGQRGYVFRAFTALVCWQPQDPGEPVWLKFDEAALQEALKALHQINSKRKERTEKRDAALDRREYQRQCEFQRETKPDGSEVVDLKVANAKPARKACPSDGEESTPPPLLIGDPRITRLEHLVDEELKAEYEMSEGVEVRYGLHQRTIRGFHDLQKKWNDTIKDAPYSDAAKAQLLAILRDYQKDNATLVGSVRLFEALLEEPNWLIWREPSAKQQSEWRKAAKLPADTEFAADPLQALTDERELIEEIERLSGPIRFTPADPVHSRRQFYFSDVTALDKKNRLRHDRQTLDTEIAVNTGTANQPKWERRWVRIAFSAPRLLRDELNNTGGKDAAFQQAMMEALGLRAKLKKTEKGQVRTAGFEECTAVALMPDVLPNGEKRILLNFPIKLEDDAIARALGKAERWNSLQFGGADGESYWLRWPGTWIDEKKERKKAPPAPWWKTAKPFSVLSVDLGQRDAGAFALIEASPGQPPKPQSRKLGETDGTTWWATVRATGMLRLPGENAQVIRDGQWQQEFSGNRGRLATEVEWQEARDICAQLGLVPDKVLGTDPHFHSFPEMNDRLLYALRRAQSRLARLQSWSCVDYTETEASRKDAFEKRRAAIKEEIQAALKARLEEQAKPEAEREQEAPERGQWLDDVRDHVEKNAWPLVAERLKREVELEREAIKAQLVRIADRIQPLRGRRWEWVLRPGDTRNHFLRQTDHGSDPRPKLLAGQRGLSLKRIEQLESLRQRCQSLNRALQQEIGKPARLGRSKRGIELPDPCPELLDRLDALKEQRVNQTAHLILAQALGVRLKPHAKDDAERTARDIHGEYERIPGREPVDFLVLENLDRYLASQGRSRSENSRLMKWCHRAILGKLKQLCEPYGLRVLETPAAYSSKFCSLTGVAGYRAVELTPDDRTDFRWKKHLDRLADPERVKKLNKDELAESQSVKRLFDQLEALNADLIKHRPARPKWRTLLAPMQLGPIFVPMRGKPMQADINAAINLGLRAIAAPDADDIHLRIRAMREGETFRVRAENAREKARWKDKPLTVAVAKDSERKKLLENARLNFFFDNGGVATFDRATIEGVQSPVASGRGLWAAVNQNDWPRCEALNASRLKHPHSRRVQDDIPMD